LPLDHFTVSNGKLCFEDLAVKHNFAAPRQYEVTWFHFDNKTENHTPLSGEPSFRLPGELDRADEGSYFTASVHASGDEQKTVTVFLRESDRAAEVVGIERKW
jgi:hypothetical protein